jgi:hypothetical protein
MEKPTRDKSQAETEGATIREIKAKYTHTPHSFKQNTSIHTAKHTSFIFTSIIFSQNELSAKKLPCKKKEC